MKQAQVLTLFFLFAAALGCDDDSQSRQGSGPATSRSAALPPDHPEVGEGSLPSLPSGHIKGEIRIAPELAKSVSAGDVIFLMARNAATGKLVAVKKLAVPNDFPLEFELTGKDVMHSDTGLAGKVRLVARVDKDGDAMTKTPGDVRGESEELVQVPAKDAVLLLDEEVTEESL